jgi:hypothetical protein
MRVGSLVGRLGLFTRDEVREGSRTEVAEGTEEEGCTEGVEAQEGYLGKGDEACLVRVVLPYDFRGIRASGAGGHDLLRW